MPTEMPNDPTTQTEDDATSNGGGPQRKYDSPVRRRQVAETRQRILRSGADLLHGFPIWNWSALTVQAVADRAGVSARTVYRYFPSERSLRDSVMELLQREADITLDGLGLDEIAEVTRRRMRYASQFPLVPRTPRDATVLAANQRQQAALSAAVAAAAPSWTADERAKASAMLDVVWGVVGFERLVTDWEMDVEDAIGAITWVIDLIGRAIRDDDRPPGASGPGEPGSA